jgi:hypothetical protein
MYTVCKRSLYCGSCSCPTLILSLTTRLGISDRGCQAYFVVVRSLERGLQTEVVICSRAPDTSDGCNVASVHGLWHPPVGCEDAMVTMSKCAGWDVNTSARAGLWHRWHEGGHEGGHPHVGRGRFRHRGHVVARHEHVWLWHGRHEDPCGVERRLWHGRHERRVCRVAV